ncbi:cenp-o kinetochore centromere component [Ophiostoma piceae UAMH 11346]|uniref:Cenp-o kinetochore centromere component n=1 Tax=Ophiostoma piceae (strain UAMH 11346) TaxID=1262450 RepID=S3CG71_OPHP1|nr:cenp-o kinetochore centromere component [Ophiostoma piceae UAMH 11346]
MASLDDEIEQLRERAAALKKQLQVQTSTLLSAPSTRRLISENRSSSTRAAKKLLKLCDSHDAHKQQSLYRAGAAVTAFRVRDPDPNAVDGGRVLGLRFDIMIGAQFLRPYYILLNRDDGPKKSGLRIHRHTVPPAVPLAGLATRHLSKTGTGAEDDDDLYAFARAVRRAIVRYHNRLAAIGDLRRGVQKAAFEGDGEIDTDRPIDVSGADAEAKQIRFDWADGRTGRLIIDDDGDIEEMVVIGATGTRDRAAARALLGNETTALGLVRRISGT